MRPILKRCSTRSVMIGDSRKKHQNEVEKVYGGSDSFHRASEPLLTFSCRTIITQASDASEFSRSTMRRDLEDDEHFSERSNSSLGSCVRFDTIEILEFRRQLGDNPSVRFGVPIAIGGKCVSRRTVSIDEYEQEKPKRHRSELLLDGIDRMDLLKEFGYGRNEIISATKAAAAERDERHKSADKWLRRRSRRQFFQNLFLASCTGQTDVLLIQAM